MIQPQHFQAIAKFHLGHFAESDGEHYVALEEYYESEGDLV